MDTPKSKRERKEVNYADSESLDISDDDEFSGFSPVHTTTKHTSKIDKSVTTTISSTDDSGSSSGKLGKRRHIRHVMPKSPVCSSSTTTDDETTLAASPSLKRMSRQDKLFQRDLDAALALSRQEAVKDSREDKENSDTNVVHNEEVSSLTKVQVPVEVHTARHANNVRPRCNLDTVVTENLINSSSKLPANISNDKHRRIHEEINDSIITLESEKITRDITKNVSKSSRAVRRKSIIIRSDSEDDTFNTVNKVISRDEKVQQPDSNISVSNKKIENHPVAKTKVLDNLSETVETNIKLVVVNDSPNKSREVTTVRELKCLKDRKRISEASTETMLSSRSKRARRAVSFKPETDSEAEWSEEEEHDEDNISDGSDFAPSPQKKIKPPKNLKDRNVKSDTPSNRKTENKDSKITKANPSDGTKHSSSQQSILVTSQLSESRLSPNIGNNMPDKYLTLQKDLKGAATSKNAVILSANSPGFCKPIKIGNTNNFVTDNQKRVTASSPLPGRIKTAFKSPLAGSIPRATGNKNQSSPTPAAGLRIGLSRRASLKSLHPNATVK